jgi:hypothetical protein
MVSSTTVLPVRRKSGNPLQAEAARSKSSAACTEDDDLMDVDHDATRVKFPDSAVFNFKHLTMAAVQLPTRPASCPPTGDIASLKRLLQRKLQNIPEFIVPTIKFNDILLKSPHVVHIPSVPSDIQLPFLLRNRASIDRHFGRAIKDENEQSLDVTRAIFFYHLDEAHLFQRHHDIVRWNLAIFTALLFRSVPSSTAPPSRKSHSSVPEAKQITPAARRFMISYLVAVMERHNTPTVFDKREEFVRRWKDSKWDLFHLSSAQKKVVKKDMKRLSAEWEAALDLASTELGKSEYGTRIAPFVRCLIPGRTDQSIPREHLSVAMRPDSLPPKAVSMEKEESKNEFLEALNVPLEEAGRYEGYAYPEDNMTPVPLRNAIASLSVTPVDMLRGLMRLFPIAGGN